MSTPNRQPASFSNNNQSPYQQGNPGSTPTQQPGNNQQPQGYFADQYGNPMFAVPSQGTVRMGSHGPIGYPEVPSDPWNDNSTELYVDRPAPRWVPGPLPPGWSMPQQGPTTQQTPSGPQGQTQTQASPAPRTPQGPAQAATTQSPVPARSSPAAVGRRSSSTGGGVMVFPGFPTRDRQLPANLSCYQVCQQYPNHLVGSNLDAFLQHNWSSLEIYHCLPASVQTIMPQKNPTWMTNRMRGRQDDMIRDGVWDRDIRGAALQGNYLRDDGRPNGMTRLKSKSTVPDAKTIRPDGVK